MENPPVAQKSPASPLGLSSLSSVVLEGAHQSLFAEGVKTCAGSGPFRARKETELHEFLALCQISNERLKPLGSNLTAALQFHFILEGPVPVWKSDIDDIEIHSWSHGMIFYPEEALRQSSPGTLFVRICKPDHVWHPNVADDDTPDPLPGRALCLGQSIRPGTRVRELILMTWGALTMQSAQLDVLDPAGLLNPKAANWWLQNRSMMPLSREPFIRPDA